MNTSENVNAKCPFFNGSTEQHIRCRDEENPISLTVNFKTKGEKKTHLKENCYQINCDCGVRSILERRKI